jgi:hypothetical protein
MSSILFQKPIKFTNECLFLERFLHGQCQLNSILTERLATYLVKHNQLNDFTLTLFSSRVTCLKRLVLNVKYLSRLQCHILNQHAYLTELELIFKDSNNTRTNDLFYQFVCPPIDAKFDDIYTTYGAFVLNDVRSSTHVKDSLTSNQYLFPRSSHLAEGFSHQKLLNIILNSLHASTYGRLRSLKVAHHKFFAAYHMVTTRKSSLVDMSPLTKW